MKKENIDTNSLAHTKWNCKYHIVFAPKYRRKVFLEVMSMEGSRNHRGRSMPKPYTYVSKYPAQNEHFGFYGLFEGKKFVDDFSKVGEYEIRIPKSRILV